MLILIVDEDFRLFLQRIEASAKEMAERFREAVEEIYRDWVPVSFDVEAEGPHPIPPRSLGGARDGTPGVVRGRWIDCTPTRGQAA